MLELIDDFVRNYGNVGKSWTTRHRNVFFASGIIGTKFVCLYPSSFKRWLRIIATKRLYRTLFCKRKTKLHPPSGCWRQKKKNEKYFRTGLFRIAFRHMEMILLCSKTFCYFDTENKNSI